MYGYNAEQPIAIPIYMYTILPYCVIYVSFTSSRRVKERIILFSRWKTSFHAKFQVHCSYGLLVLTYVHVGISCITMYCED